MVTFDLHGYRTFAEEDHVTHWRLQNAKWTSGWDSVLHKDPDGPHIQRIHHHKLHTVWREELTGCSQQGAHTANRLTPECLSNTCSDVRYIMRWTHSFCQQVPHDWVQWNHILCWSKMSKNTRLQVKNSAALSTKWKYLNVIWCHCVTGLHNIL